MAKKILIAMDDSENAQRAVALVARLFSPDQEVTLFSVLADTATLCDMNSPALTPYFKSGQQSFCALEDEKKKLVVDAMDHARTLLIEAGFDSTHIHLKRQTKKRGIARDIVAEAGEGYEMVVLGRRGVSAIKEFLMGSISQKVMHLLKEGSVLIVN